MSLSTILFVVGALLAVGGVAKMSREKTFVGRPRLTTTVVAWIGVLCIFASVLVG